LVLEARPPQQSALRFSRTGNDTTLVANARKALGSAVYLRLVRPAGVEQTRMRAYYECGFGEKPNIVSGCPDGSGSLRVPCRKHRRASHGGHQVRVSPYWRRVDVGRVGFAD